MKSYLKSNNTDVDKLISQFGGLSIENNLSKKFQSDDVSDEDNYYLVEFDEIICTVLHEESFLFSKDELQWWEKYQFLAKDSKYILARIYSRKFGWINVNSFNSIISSLTMQYNPVEQLTDFSLIQSTKKDPIPLSELLVELTLFQIKDLIKDFRLPIKSIGKKEDLIKSILTITKDSKIDLESKLVKHCLTSFGELIRMDPIALKFFNRVNSIFTRFGSLPSVAMNNALRAHTGKLNFYDYKVARCNKVFPNYQALLEYEVAIKKLYYSVGLFNQKPVKLDNFQLICNVSEKVRIDWKLLIQNDYTQNTSHYLLRFTPAHPYTKLMMIYIQSLGKLKRFEEEVSVLIELLGQSKYFIGERGAWWDRLCLLEARHLSKIDKSYLNKSYQHCIRALQDTVNGGIDQNSKNSIYSRLISLEKKLRIVATDRCQIEDPTTPAPPLITLAGILCPSKSKSRSTRWQIDGTTRGVSVEQFVIHHLARDGYKGKHTENTILPTIFSLLFLDILFHPKDGVFETKLQTHPLDFGTDAFYIDRKTEIDERLKIIKDNKFKSILEAHYRRNISKKPQVIGLNWDYELSDLVEITKCIGGTNLAPICLIFCKDYFYHSSGMPDLCLWNVDKKECKFIEVKSPNDTLKDKQKIWINHLINANIPVQVCHVVSS